MLVMRNHHEGGGGPGGQEKGKIELRDVTHILRLPPGSVVTLTNLKVSAYDQNFDFK